MSDNPNTAEIRRLYDAATPGTWEVVDGIIGRTIIVKSHFLFELLRECSDEDAEFIAAAHNSMPALLDLLEAYRAAMRRAVVNAGGIAEEGVSDKFLLENVSAEMALLRAVATEMTIALQSIQANSCPQGIDRGDSMIYRTATEALK